MRDVVYRIRRRRLTDLATSAELIVNTEGASLRVQPTKKYVIRRIAFIRISASIAAIAAAATLAV